MAHAGLIVFNLTDKKHLKKGLMVWNGLSWCSMKTKDYDVEPLIKKRLYCSYSPELSKSLTINSIELAIRPGNKENSGLPNFRVRPTHAPSGSYTRKFLYNITRYWTGENHEISSGEFSTDLYLTSFTQSNASDYREFRIGYMTSQEKDEIWLVDDQTNDIFHIQFFVMGHADIDGTQFAIFVERF
jgi:hypothetical protein